MFIPIGIGLVALVLFISKKKKATTQAETPKPPIETTIKTPLSTTVKAPTAAPVKGGSNVVEVGTGHLSDVLFGPIRQTTTKPTKAPIKAAPIKTPPVVKVGSGNTLGNVFWGAIRK
jgi:hypothetical protein